MWEKLRNIKKPVKIMLPAMISSFLVFLVIFLFMSEHGLLLIYEPYSCFSKFRRKIDTSKFITFETCYAGKIHDYCPPPIKVPQYY